MRRRHLAVIGQATLFAAVVGALLFTLEGPAGPIWLLLCGGTALMWTARALADAARHRRLRQALAPSVGSPGWTRLEADAVEDRLAPCGPTIRDWLTDGRSTGFVRWHIAQAWAHGGSGVTVFELHAWPGFQSFGIPVWRTMQVGTLGSPPVAGTSPPAHAPHFTADADGQRLGLWARQHLDVVTAHRVAGLVPPGGA